MTKINSVKKGKFGYILNQTQKYENATLKIIHYKLTKLTNPNQVHRYEIKTVSSSFLSNMRK